MRKSFLFILLITLLATSAFGEVGVINDPDGYTNVRKEKSTSSPIVSKIFKGEIFSYQPVKGDKWYSVIVKGQSGYVHSSRIVNVLSLPNAREVLLEIFRKENQLLQLQTERTKNEHSDFFENVYCAALESAGDFIAKNQDDELFKLMIENKLLDKGNASEAPSFALGYVFIANPQWASGILKAYRDKDLLGFLDWGIQCSESQFSKDKGLKAKQAFSLLENTFRGD